MTARHKHAPGSAGVNGNGNGVENGADRSTSLAWDDWFRHAAPQQRALVLGLAQQQGLLYAHQLPTVTNGKPATQQAASESAASRALARFLAGKAEPLPALDALTLACFDADLDDLQQQSVQRAIASPDVFLLQGLPGTGKSRVVVEILLQAAARGWRTLFLAGQTASIDVVLEQLAGKPQALALRFLEALEKPESLPGRVRNFTLDEQKKAFIEGVNLGARSNCERAEAACQRYGEQQPLWDQLNEGAQRHRHLTDQRAKLQEQIAQIAAAVEGSADQPGELQADFTRLAQACDQSIAELESTVQRERAELAQCDQNLADIAAQIAAIAPGYDARKHGRFWKVAYWLSNAQTVADMEALQKQQAEAEQRKGVMVQKIDELIRQVDQRREQFQQERATLIAGAVAERRQALQAEAQTLTDELVGLDADWATRCADLNAGPIDKTCDAVALAHQSWLEQKTLREEECQFARQWAAFLDEAAPQWVARLSSFANVLAGTVGRWHTDAKFREAAATPCDLVILEDADALAEADLAKLAGLGARCVLVRTTLCEKPTLSGWWQRLWQTLGGDATWPHVWQRSESKLVCQLIPLAAADQAHLYCESLADAADIELRILHRPDSRPCLAQVSFGADIPFADAFTFMIREVQEFPLQPLGRTGWWREDDRCVRRHLGPCNGKVHAWVEIEAGVRLGTAAAETDDATRVAVIEFDKSAAWDRCRADGWLKRVQSVHDCERTAHLQIPYRFRAPLRETVAAVVHCGDWLLSPAQPRAARGFEFVSVPGSTKCEGAGLELDLSVPRNTDKLPAGLRQGLPTRGFVNYPEAQALLGRLEAWSQNEATDGCRVAVLALYEGQAVLLRRLIEQSEVLRARRHLLEVGVPSRLHQREYDAVFLSMTRSPAQRAGAFGEDVRELPLALTRARTTLIVFGDAGAIATRLGHQGPLDRQDAAAAQQEHAQLSRLIACMQP